MITPCVALAGVQAPAEFSSGHPARNETSMQGLFESHLKRLHEGTVTAIGE
jgi:hypothetical protein